MITTTNSRLVSDPGAGRYRPAVAIPDWHTDRVFARWSRVEGPVDDLYLVSTEAGIAGSMPASSVTGDDEAVETFRARLGRPVVAAGEVPAGVTEAVSTGRAGHLRFDLGSLTQFEQAVLNTTLDIPPGEVRPYSWIAHHIGRPGAVRAVGSALGHNPVPVLIPCHRVIRSDGAVGEYRFGPDAKRRLLAAEGADFDRVRDLVGGGSVYVGDRRSGLVCLPACHRLRRSPQTAWERFATLSRAVEAGMAPCPYCRPVGR